MELTPQVLELLMEDARIQGDQDRLNRLLTLADELRAGAQQPLQGTMAGRMYVPPSPWQGVAGLGQAGLGAAREIQANRLREQQTTARGGMRQALLAEMLRQQNPAPNPTVPAATAPAGPRPPWAGM